MKIAGNSNEVVEKWWALIRHASAESRLELASRLINSLKTGEPKENKAWKQLYGAWADDGESAEDLIELIRKARR